MTRTGPTHTNANANANAPRTSLSNTTTGASASGTYDSSAVRPNSGAREGVGGSGGSGAGTKETPIALLDDASDDAKGSYSTSNGGGSGAGGGGGGGGAPLGVGLNGTGVISAGIKRKSMDGHGPHSSHSGLGVGLTSGAGVGGGAGGGSAAGGGSTMSIGGGGGSVGSASVGTAGGEEEEEGGDPSVSSGVGEEVGGVEGRCCQGWVFPHPPLHFLHLLHFLQSLHSSSRLHFTFLLRSSVGLTLTSYLCAVDVRRELGRERQIPAGTQTAPVPGRAQGDHAERVRR